MEPRWLEWGKRLASIAQNGLLFTRDPFDAERYQQVRELAAEMLASQSDTEVTVVLDFLSAAQGYATPQVDVRGVAFRADRILLVRERSDQLWSLPGGWAEVGSSPKENVEREIHEEAGLAARATRLLAVYDRSRHGHNPPHPLHVYKMFFECELLGGDPRPGLDTLDVGFFQREALPPLSQARVTLQQLERFFDYRQHPEGPADFD
ncbi:MAG: NUDIX hydrolase [Candidatus Binataceae bacterium]